MFKMTAKPIASDLTISPSQHWGLGQFAHKFHALPLRYQIQPFRQIFVFRRSALKPLTFLLFMIMPMVLASRPAAGHYNQAKIQARQSGVQAEAREQYRRDVGSIRVVVDRSDRRVQVYRGDEVIRSEAVAIGMPKYPTPTGSWRLHRIDLNPEWNPPKSDWTKGRKRTPPGSPENPMGLARLVFDMPYTIHGTDVLESLGKAASHGSVRISNEVVMDLAELLLRAGGSWSGDQWFQRMSENRGKMYQIKMQYPVPIDIVE